MAASRGFGFDATLSLLIEGYAWLPERVRRSGGAAVRTRLFGRPTVGIRGLEAVRFFYDERNIERGPAVPGFVQSTLFGHGAVHTLDGVAHRHRKAMFMYLLHDPRLVARLAEQVAAAWTSDVPRWAAADRIVLFDRAACVITAGVCEWAGIPMTEQELPGLASDLVAMVEGFATLGQRHWRAMAARNRREIWLSQLIEELRDQAAPGVADPPLAAVAFHTDLRGQPLPARTAAVEVLNLIRPTVAIAWFVAFAAHAMHRWPEHRPRVAADRGYALAFANEVRRFYPFAPFVGGRAVTDLTWSGLDIPEGTTVLLDIFGQDHDPGTWPAPYRFDPQRFVDRQTTSDLLIPQGGGDPATNHRCPGEDVVLSVLTRLAMLLAELEYRLPVQDLTISLGRIPARPASGVVLELAGSGAQPDQGAWNPAAVNTANPAGERT